MTAICLEVELLLKRQKVTRARWIVKNVYPALRVKYLLTTL